MADIKKAQEIVQSTETGARQPKHGIGKWLLFAVPIAWALFQLWYASPFPFEVGIGVFNDTEARSIHLGFAIFLAFLAFPFNKHKHTHHIPVIDYIFALAGAFSASYLFLFYADLAARSGAPTLPDVVISVIGMLLLLEATRRALGPPLMVVATVFLLYTFLGPHMPDVIAHKGASLNKATAHYWLTTEGVFGVALGVSTSFVFLFVLFGALLEKAGAGNYFVRVAFSLLGHMRGGPAKAAVVSSGLSGLISGSSIANVVTTGTFTIPLMKKVGFPSYKAGAVEVAASTNGQLTPPIMGAAAFLMVEYVGISYIEVIKHAILPALISYIALIYIVHLEACKAGMKGLPSKGKALSALQKLTSFLLTFIAFGALCAAVYYGLGWTKDVMGSGATYVASAVMAMAYIGLVWYAAQYPQLTDLHKEKEITHLPEVGPTVKAGLFFLLPVFVLVWCLMVERFSPGLSAFWATSYMIFISVTHKPLDAFFRKHRLVKHAFYEGLQDLVDGLGTGAKNMIGIGVATAAAGIVVGTVTLTGIGLVMTEFVEFISGGNVMLMLLFTAVISLILGMGLPTTANYIVVSTLMAPVIVELGASTGLVVPLIAVHLFVFYFGILADDTPPVGLAAFAASAIAKSDPIKTGIQGFKYDIRTAILPFMFIFNTQLLLIGINGWLELIITIASATLAMLVFAAATQRFWLTKTKWWESLALLLIAFTLFRPGFWWDMVYPPLHQRAPTEIYKVVDELPQGDVLRLRVEGENIDGDFVSKAVILPLGEGENAREKVEASGVILRQDGAQMIFDQVIFGSEAAKLGIDYDWRIAEITVAHPRPPKQWMFIPALLLLGFIYRGQRKKLTALEAR
jgi:TRAP transporter 4TM/12TM fusion protein